ncbi:MAG: tail fiber domain-containing protein [Bacteroidota bacterium]|nr:tail fiber domain-containing protein [Bacteroidota bacterium]
MKKTTLTKTTLITFSLAFAFTGKGQVKVDPNNNVLVGQHWGQNAYKEFDVRGEMFVSHFPRNGVLGWNYVGCWFTNHSYQFGGNTIYRPILEPQWGNNYWLGNASSPFWRVYSNEMHAMSFVNISDERLKTNFMPVTGSLSRLMSILPYRYDFIFTPDEEVDETTNQEVEAASKNHIGFKAQDLLKDFPHLVKYDESEDQYSVNYIGLIPELVAALQEQNQVIQELKAKVAELESSVGE